MLSAEARQHAGESTSNTEPRRALTASAPVISPAVPTAIDTIIREHIVRALDAILVIIPECWNLRQPPSGERASMESAMTQAAPNRARFIAFAVQFRWLAGTMKIDGAWTRTPKTTNIAVSSLAPVLARIPVMMATAAAQWATPVAQAQNT